MSIFVAGFELSGKTQNGSHVFASAKHRGRRRGMSKSVKTSKEDDDKCHSLSYLLTLFLCRLKDAQR